MRMTRTAVPATFLCAIGACIPFDAEAATAFVDTSAVQQTIRGFGGATVFQPPGLPASLSTSELDTLFGNGPDQIGFTILRIRVAEDDAWRAIELAHAQGAKARGAEVIATPWSPPAAMKSNNSLIDGFLNPSSYAAYAIYLNDFAEYMATNGASLYAISVQNEPDIAVEYESCDWTPEQMLNFCRDHADAITATRLIAPESFQFRRNMSDPILNDDQAAANVEIIGGHIYGGGLADYPLARNKDKDVWMTEHLELSTDWAGALATGKEIHDCLAVANFNAYIWWYLRRYYGPLGEDGVITKRGHVMSHFTKFIRPGYVRVDATASPSTNVYVSAYKAERLVIVAINQGGSAVDQTFSIQDGTLETVAPWLTSESVSMAAQSAIAVSGGTFTASLPAQSVTTFVGERIFPPPEIISTPQSHAVATGDTVVLEVNASGEFPTYQWSRNGAPIPGATTRLLTVDDAQDSDAGAYTVTVANSGGSVTSTAATVSVTTTGNPGRLTSISTRSLVGTGNDVQIGGFVIAGSAQKEVLVRAAGPELDVSFGVSGVLADPAISLVDQGTGAVIDSNDDWDASLAATFASAQAFPWTDGSKDAAVLTTLDPGTYTAVVSGADGGSGVALIEIYELAGGVSESKFIGISTRALVGTGDSVQIGGFAIGGITARTVVIRASGPALDESFGIGNALTDPVLSLYNQANGAVITIADNWEELFTPHFDAVGAFPWTKGSKDAAIVMTLDPGAYSVIVSDKNGGTGIALLEIYDRP